MCAILFELGQLRAFEAGTPAGRGTGTRDGETHEGRGGNHDGRRAFSEREGAKPEMSHVNGELWSAVVRTALLPYFGTSVQKPLRAHRKHCGTPVQSLSALHGGPCLPGTHDVAGVGAGGAGPGAAAQSAPSFQPLLPAHAVSSSCELLVSTAHTA